MKGYQLTFYTQQNREYKGVPIARWIMDEAQKFGIPGATMMMAAEGMGRDGKLHSVSFFELTEQPVEVKMAINEQQADSFLEHIAQSKLRIFYVKTPIEYGIVGETE